MKPFEMTRGMRIGTALLAAMIRVGFPMGPLRLLTVRGRKSGRSYTTPVALVIEDGSRYLVAPFGEVGWVHNIRAAGNAQLRGGMSEEVISVTELNSALAAPVLKLFRTRFGMVPFIRPYFEATPQSPISDFEREAKFHPVFRIN